VLVDRLAQHVAVVIQPAPNGIGQPQQGVGDSEAWIGRGLSRQRGDERSGIAFIGGHRMVLVRF
jgi:hypothetical protein